MLDLSGGDTAALTEITEAQNAALAQPQLNPVWMAKLAVHRLAIIERFVVTEQQLKKPDDGRFRPGRPPP